MCVQIIETVLFLDYKIKEQKRRRRNIKKARETVNDKIGVYVCACFADSFAGTQVSFGLGESDPTRKKRTRALTYA